MTKISLDDRVVLITGGARGLGREMALALADAGARVAITGASDSEALHKTRAALGSSAIAIRRSSRAAGPGRLCPRNAAKARTIAISVRSGRS